MQHHLVELGVVGVLVRAVESPLLGDLRLERGDVVPGTGSTNTTAPCRQVSKNESGRKVTWRTFSIGCSTTVPSAGPEISGLVEIRELVT